MDPRTKKLLQDPIGATILRLALPNIVVMVVQSLVGLIETYFVAKLGLDALTGMALVFPVLMLTQMLSAGAVGGGILSAVARALGGGRTADANELAWQTVWLSLSLGVVTSLAVLLGGRWLYSLMGGRDGSLAAALTYSNFVFAGAILIWTFNSLAAVIRGTGNMALPAIVSAVGAVVLIPASPALIFGFGPVPHLGIIGGAVAVVLYYAVGTAIFAGYIWSGRGVLAPQVRPPRLHWAPLRDIMRVGAVSSLVSVSTNLIIGTTTGLAGLIGPAAAAGYGTGARLEYLLIPLVFGLGAPVAAMVGTNIGAGQHERALRVAWTGALISGVLTEAIGLGAALFPHAWLSQFGDDPLMIEVGTHYLRIVGPFYGFFGAGLALYFASQGAGRLAWPLVASTLRVAVVLVGGWIVTAMFGGVTALFAVLGVAMAVYGGTMVLAIANGAWFERTRTTLALQPSLGRC